MNSLGKADPLKAWAKRLIRLGALILVVWGIWQCIRTSTGELRQQQEQLAIQAQELIDRAEAEPDPREATKLRSKADALLVEAGEFWRPNLPNLALASFLYCCALFPAALFWRRCVVEMDQAHHLLDTLWAYFYANLGKYFPGKAMVIVMRITALENHRVKKIATTVTIFMETLSVMAVGCAVSAVCLILLDLDWRLTALAVGLLLLTFLPTSPPLIRYLLPRLQRGVDPEEIQKWTSRIRWRLFFRGWVMLSVGWMLHGLSLLLVLQSLPSQTVVGVDWGTSYLAATGACALAVVLGFVSLLPGGAGVRELVISAVLAPVFGPTAALCAALWHRMAAILGELILAGIFFSIRSMGWTYKPPESSSEESKD
ncbi:MAG: lysylphosphatidylglycerol synthase domain-containing protein [Planctomycetota bacterium]